MTAKDVIDQPHQLGDLIQGPTLLVAITDRGSGDAMQAWFDAADRRAPDVGRISIVSIDKPFFVSDDYARSKARDRVPLQWWHATLFDTNHAMAKTLGLSEDPLPYAIAVGSDGRVLAVVHAKPDTPQAQQIWNALDHSEPRRPESAPAPAPAPAP